MELRFSAIRGSLVGGGFLLGLVFSAPLGAQQHRLLVLGDDDRPVPFASVSINGGPWRVAGQDGLVALGQATKQTLSADVRRIGFKPSYSKLEFPDTALTIPVHISALAQTLEGVTVSGGTLRSLEIVGFYQRLLDRQKGLGSGIFIGPDEIEARNTNLTTNLLRGLNSVKLLRTSRGNGLYAFAQGKDCSMAVYVDGVRMCPPGGCHRRFATSLQQKGGAIDTVNIDDVAPIGHIAAIEIYARSTTMPSSAPQPPSDTGCGVIAIWTGSRR